MRSRLDAPPSGAPALPIRYNRNGLTQWEQTDLQRRLQAVRSQIRYALGGGEAHGGYGYDYYGAGYGDDDRWNGRDDDWNDREDGDGDRDRWDDQGYGQGGFHAVPDRYLYRYRGTDSSHFRYRDGYIYEFDRYSGRVINRIWVGRQ
jgi:hypothetical protein